MTAVSAVTSGHQRVDRFQMQVVPYLNEDATFVLHERQGQFLMHARGPSLLRGSGQLTLCTDVTEINLSWLMLPVWGQVSANSPPPC